MSPKHKDPSIAEKNTLITIHCVNIPSERSFSWRYGISLVGDFAPIGLTTVFFKIKHYASYPSPVTLSSTGVRLALQSESFPPFSFVDGLWEWRLVRGGSRVEWTSLEMTSNHLSAKHTGLRGYESLTAWARATKGTKQISQKVCPEHRTVLEKV